MVSASTRYEVGFEVGRRQGQFGRREGATGQVGHRDHVGAQNLVQRGHRGWYSGTYTSQRMPTTQHQHMCHHMSQSHELWCMRLVGFLIYHVSAQRTRVVECVCVRV